jgi:molecular chaperone GrpE
MDNEADEMMTGSDPDKTPASSDEAKAAEIDAAAEADASGSADTKRRRDKKKRPRQVLVNEERLNELEEKEKKADEYYGHYVRARADMDNLRKRLQRDRDDFVKFANERLLSEVIPILDNFERAFTAAEKVPATHNFALGVEMILKQLRDALARYGVEEINPAGERFDPARHEAAETLETTEHADHTVVDVLQRGYVLNGRVVQPAVVRVAVNPEGAPQEPAETDEPSGASGKDMTDLSDENNTHTDTQEAEDGQDHRH